MESVSKQTIINDILVDDADIQKESLADGIHEIDLVRPTVLPCTTNICLKLGYFDVDQLCMSPSPMDMRPRFFQAGTLFDSNTYQKTLRSVYDQQKMHDKEEEEEHDLNDDDDDDDDEKNNISNEKLFDERLLNNERTKEIQYLTQVIRDDQPANDNIASIIMQQLHDILETIVNIDDNNENESEASSMILTTYPYPPVNQIGPIADHDRPYADYGHLDAKTIAKELDFNLTCAHPNNAKSSRGPIRMTTKTWAITSWTTVSKETVIAEIKRQFGIEQLQYACVAQEIGDQNDAPHLHMQIILKKKANKKTWFLDDITGTHCNYQVTINDRAWNEYIKKGLNFIEFGSFKSTTAWAQKEWSSQMSSSLLLCPFSSSSFSSSSLPSYCSSSRAHSTTIAISRHRPATFTTTATTSTMSRIQQTKERYKHEKEIARHALELAHTNVHNAMDLIRHSMPDKFLAHSSWYLSTFNYVHLRAQQEAEKTGNIIDKEYIWPLSFPDCTPKLKEAIDQWIRHHFSRAKRAKCLILIGSTCTGKTSFALSLPGRVNYFKERWNLEKWNDYARYSIYDDVPWDDFAKLNYPNKKGLLTQNGKINATDKYRGTREINVRQPAIVLLNPEDAGSLLAKPITMDEQRTANYWNKRAFIYIMDSNEYFYKKQKLPTNTDDIQLSSNSSMGTSNDRIGEADEFDQMIQRYQERHPSNNRQ